MFSDLLEEYKDEPERLGDVLRALDYMVKYIHDNGYYISDFDPQKIMLINGKLSPKSFQGLLANMDFDPRGKRINIYQASKIGLMAYNHMKVDGNMNQSHYEFIRDNLNSFDKNKQIPEEIFEYYQELYLNGVVDYLNNYLEKIENAKSTQGNSNTIRKTLSSEAGRALTKMLHHLDDSLLLMIIIKLLLIYYLFQVF